MWFQVNTESMLTLAMMTWSKHGPRRRANRDNNDNNTDPVSRPDGSVGLGPDLV